MTGITTLIAAFLGGGGIFTFIIFLIQRRDNLNKQLKELEEIRLDLCRLQLLNLIQHEGSQHQAMTVAEKYFKELKGDWYMTPIFCKWLKDHDLDKPVWFMGGDD